MSATAATVANSADRSENERLPDGLVARGFIPIFTPIRQDWRENVGEKFYKLWDMYAQGLNVPAALCLSKEICAYYLRKTGLQERLNALLARKSTSKMSREEIWDLKLRVEGLFLSTRLPPPLYEKLAEQVSSCFAQHRKSEARTNRRMNRRWDWIKEVPITVRVSPPFGDSSRFRTLRLFETYMNVRGIDSIVRHILMCWASLWSHTFLLFRSELSSAFAFECSEILDQGCPVILQFCLSPTSSGYVIPLFPDDASRFNSEPLDVWEQFDVGTLSQPTEVFAYPGVYPSTTPVEEGWEPDQWLVRLDSSRVIYQGNGARKRKYRGIPSDKKEGCKVEHLPENSRGKYSISEEMVKFVAQLGLALQGINQGVPQCVEWALVNEELYVLQAVDLDDFEDPDERFAKMLEEKISEFHSFFPSISKLQQTLYEVRDQLLPSMESDAARFASVNVRSLSDQELVNELQTRHEKFHHYRKLYSQALLDLTHAHRFFGKFYNAIVQPDDLFEYVKILSSSGLSSIRRNYELLTLMYQIRSDPALAETTLSICFAENQQPLSILEQQFPEFSAALKSFISQYGGSPVLARFHFHEWDVILKFLVRMAINCTDVSAPADNPYLSLNDFEYVFFSRYQENAPTSTTFISSYFIERDPSAEAATTGTAPAPAGVAVSGGLSRQIGMLHSALHSNSTAASPAERILELGRFSNLVLGDRGLAPGLVEAQFLLACYEAERRILESTSGRPFRDSSLTIGSLEAMSHPSSCSLGSSLPDSASRRISSAQDGGGDRSNGSPSGNSESYVLSVSRRRHGGPTSSSSSLSLASSDSASSSSVTGNGGGLTAAGAANRHGLFMGLNITSMLHEASWKAVSDVRDLAQAISAAYSMQVLSPSVRQLSVVFSRDEVNRVESVVMSDDAPPTTSPGLGGGAPTASAAAHGGTTGGALSMVPPASGGGAAAVGAADSPMTTDGATVNGPPADDASFLAQPSMVMPADSNVFYGEPASPGISFGFIHWIRNADDIMVFQAGKILCCDHIDANVNFLVPVSAGVIERCGGISTAGAVASRTYGVPCVTAVTDLDEIPEGALVKLDGFLGAVTVAPPNSF